MTKAVATFNPIDNWGWVEIHWSDGTSGNFNLGQYRCPDIKKHDLQNQIPNVQALPSDYRTKSLNEMIEKLQKKNGDHQFYINEELEKEAAKMISDYNSGKVKEINKAYICSSVEQWIIVEIQPHVAVEHGLFMSFPTFDVWSFLQPFGIGSTKRMKQERGYVTNDMPRAGWFRTSVQWFAKNEPGSAKINLIPKMSIHDASGTIVEWREVECVLTNGKSPYLEQHKIKPAYGSGYRFLFRIPVVVENIETKEDRERKSDAIKLLQKAQNLTKEQADNLLRMEAGSYLKVWVRNNKCEWSKQYPPADDNTENCMRHMQLLDNRTIKPNYGDYPLYLFGTPLRVSKPQSYQSYVDYYWDHIAKNSTDLFASSRNHPLDAAYNKDTYRNTFIIEKGTLKPLTTWNPVQLTLSGPDVQLPPEPTETKSQTDDTRYQADGDYFRPFSYRNHTWKRNRFSDDGSFKEDQWHYILLWPKELMKNMDLLAGKFVSSPGQFSLIGFLAAMFCYNVYVFGLSSAAKKRKKSLKASNKKTDDDNFLKIIEKFIEIEDARQLAGAFSMYGLNMKNETGEGFSLKEYVERYKADTAGYGAAAYVDKVLALCQKMIKTVVVDIDEPDTITRNIREAISLLLTSSPSSAHAYSAAAASTQKKSISELYQKFKDKQKEDGKIKTADQSILDLKIAMEYEAVNITKQLAAYPIPIPVLSWIVFALSFKISSKLKLSIDGSNFLKSIPTTNCSFDLSGDCGFHAALGAFWTLYSRLDNDIIQKNILKKPEGTPKNPLEEWVSEALSLIGLELAASISLEVSGAFPFKFNCAPGANGKFFERAEEDKLSMVISVKIPVTGKLSIISTELFCLSFPIMAASPSAIVFFPSGVEIKTVGGFSSAFWNNYEPWRIKLSDGEFTHAVTGNDCKEIWAGKKFELCCESKKIVPPKFAKAGQKLPYFKSYLTNATNPKEKIIDLETEWVWENSKISESVTITTAKSSETAFSFSTANLYSDKKYADFITKLLQQDQKARLICAWAGNINEFAYLGPEKSNFTKADTLIIKKPFISRLSVIQGKKEKYTFSDQIILNFKPEFLNPDCKLFCFCYEINEKGSKFEARIIKGKDKKLHYFSCLPKKADNTYDIPIQLSELSHLNMTDDDDDGSVWELCFGIALDYDAKYLLQFSDRHAKSITLASTILKVKKLT